MPRAKLWLGEDPRGRLYMGRQRIKEKAQKRYSKEDVEVARQVGAFLKQCRDTEFLYFTTKQGRVYLPASLAKQVASIVLPMKSDQADTLSPWADIFVDTFSYVFFPSTGKGLDAADEYHLFDRRIREKDGKVYLGSDEGTMVITLPVNADAILKALQQANLMD